MGHIVPRARGGSDRISNLTLACEPCNQQKGTQTAAEFGHPDIQAQARRPLLGTGGRTKFNRTRLGLPKAHWHDAACVGASTLDLLDVSGVRPLLITATGHGNRQMAGLNTYGFPIRHRQRVKWYFGFQTGDIVRSVVVRGKYVGTHIGRVAVRAKPSFKLNGIDVPAKTCTALHRADGYAYPRSPDANEPTAELAAR